LHWLIAALIAAQLGLGWYMNEVLPDHSAAQEQIETLHISLGLTLMLVVAVRILWRLANRPPALPEDLSAWERRLALLVHVALYVLMVGIPLSGWVLVSGRGHPIGFWGFAWPAIPGVGVLPRPELHQIKHLHVFILIWALVVTWALHVAGAFKHQFDGHPVLWRMVPFLKRPAGKPD
jgi:cytochrome b561